MKKLIFGLLIFNLSSLYADTNIDLTPSSKGLLRSSNTFSSVNTFTSSVTFVDGRMMINGVAYTWPSSAVNGNCLQYNSGVLSWATCGSGGGGGGGSIFISTNASLQVSVSTAFFPEFNRVGVAGGASTFTVTNASNQWTASQIAQSSWTFIGGVTISSNARTSFLEVIGSASVQGIITSTTGALLGATTIQNGLTLDGGSLTVSNLGVTPFTFNFTSAPTTGQKLGVTAVAGNRLTIGGTGDNAGVTSPMTATLDAGNFGIVNIASPFSTFTAIYPMNFPMSSLVAMSTQVNGAIYVSTSMYANPYQQSLVPFGAREFSGSSTDTVVGSFIVPPNIDVSSNVRFTAYVIPKTAGTNKNVQVIFRSTISVGTGDADYNFVNSTGVDICAIQGTTGTLTKCQWSQSVSGLNWLGGSLCLFETGRGNDTGKLTSTNLSSSLYMTNLLIEVPLLHIHKP